MYVVKYCLVTHNVTVYSFFSENSYCANVCKVCKLCSVPQYVSRKVKNCPLTYLCV